MKRAPILVLADDLTGAAEIAALGFQRGLRTAVLLEAGAPIPADTELLVIDTDSRQAPPAQAAAKVRELVNALPAQWRSIVFKKTDSVLRGPVAAELEALAQTLSRPSILLCPCNPSRGRCIVQGRYSIDGVPLHQTAFARDPHFPAHTDEVLGLLGPAQRPCLAHDAAQAATLSFQPGLHLAAAASQADVLSWARRLDDSLLPAGGADFFDAFLDQLGLPPAAAPAGCNPQGPHLLLSGSLAPAGLAFRSALADTGTTVLRLPVRRRDDTALDLCLASLLSELQRQGRAVAATSDQALDSHADASWLETCFAQAALRCNSPSGFRHLLAEGGATAALAASALGWRSFTVAAVWSGGVVSLRPDLAPALLFTLKPGSYPWPPQIRYLLSPAWPGQQFTH